MNQNEDMNKILNQSLFKYKCQHKYWFIQCKNAQAVISYRRPYHGGVYDYAKFPCSSPLKITRCCKRFSSLSPPHMWRHHLPLSYYMQFAYVRKYMDSTEVHWFMHRSIEFMLSDYTLETIINLHTFRLIEPWLHYCQFLIAFRSSDANMHQETNHHWLRQWLFAWTTPSHYLNQCWYVVNWTLKNKRQWILSEFNFLFKKMHLKMSSAKWRPFCLGLNLLIQCNRAML